jgi:hypothetical protein
MWTHNPNKLKLHTSERDHPAALPGYLKCGFVIVSERMEKQAVVI